MNIVIVEIRENNTTSLAACPKCGQAFMAGFVPVFAAVVCDCGTRFQTDAQQKSSLISRLPLLAPFDFNALEAFMDPERPWNLLGKDRRLLIAMSGLTILAVSVFAFLKAPLLKPTVPQEGPSLVVDQTELSSEQSAQVQLCPLRSDPSWKRHGAGGFLKSRGPQARLQSAFA
ncbi:MAG: hypothetical protein ACI957_005974 [Verrucomicrobiales bacterium]|jgi:hypothetical protein